MARKESERRQTVQEKGKTYTDKDLKPVPAPPAAPEAASSTEKGDAAATPSDTEKAEAKPEAKVAEKEKGAAEEEVKDQQYWSKRMATLREALERDQTYLAAIQNRIDSLTTDFVNRDDPFQRSQIASDRQRAIEELERLRKAVQQDKDAIPELEEEARREGVPAGWLR